MDVDTVQCIRCKMEKQSNNVVHPNHYNRTSVEVIDTLRGMMTDDEAKHHSAHPGFAGGAAAAVPCHCRGGLRNDHAGAPAYQPGDGISQPALAGTGRRNSSDGDPRCGGSLRSSVPRALPCEV